MNFLIVGVLMFFFWTLVLSEDFGNIVNIKTTGASAATARQAGLTVKGVAASHKLAEQDLVRMKRYRCIIKKIAKENNIDPALIAAIISRESRAGAALINGKGDKGNGFGLMQVDKRWHKPKGKWNSEEHIRQGTKILIKNIKAIQKKFPKWTKDHQLKGGISAYNAGVKNVRTYKGMDRGTTGKDYSNDVVARAQWFKQHGF